MNILVTGAAGFIGSNLVGKLLEKDWRVTCLDNLSSGSLGKLTRHLANQDATFVDGDICNRQLLSELENFNKIINLACPASPQRYQADPISTLDTCYIGTQNLLKLAKKSGARLLHASTSEVYGDPHLHPQQEGYWGNVNPIGIRACYDEGKRVAETLCAEYARLWNVDARIIRIFNTYGPGMDVNDGRVVSNFINQAIRGEDLTIYGDGKQTRSFCYVDDLVEGLISALECAEFPLTPVNMGNPKEFTMIELAEMVLAKTGSTSSLYFAPLPEDDPKQRCPDIARAKTLLNWEPKTKLADGLQRTIDHYCASSLQKVS